MRKEKAIVREFYDTFGWTKNADGAYNDSAVFLNRTSATAVYQHRCRVRTKQFLKPAGQYFLDAGSGAVAHAEYLAYSAEYGRRVCVDLSLTGLREARAKLGHKGLYVVADLTSLPFKEGTFDGAICSHVLYHIPADAQESAIRELHRVARGGSRFVVLYAWPNCMLSTIGGKVQRAKQLGRAILRKSARLFFSQQPKPGEARSVAVDPTARAHPPLYYHAHTYDWFRDTFASWTHVDIRASRSVDEDFMQSCVPQNWIGRVLLTLIFWCETTFPRMFGRIGRYPAVIVGKE